MQVSVTTGSGGATVRIEGRFDFNAHREFREAIDRVLADQAAREITIDLGGVDYLDSSALGMLLMTRDKANHAGRQITLANCRGTVGQIIEIANFGKLFKIV